jgi:two-component system, response regulator
MTSGNIILLIEDSAEDAELTLRAFRKGNALNEFVIVRDGLEALDYLRDYGSHAGQQPKTLPALILLDLNLPKISGLEVLRRLRAEDRTRRIPVVVLTGSDEEGDLLSSHDLGANRFIVKPVDFARLAAAARQLGLHRLVTNEPIRE